MIRINFCPELVRLNLEYLKYLFLEVCGANVVENLWPQHMSVYQYTDILELEICKELEAGEITQATAVEKIKFAKNNIELLKPVPVLERTQFILEHFNK